MIKKFLEKILHAPKASAGLFDENGAIILDPTPLVQHLPDMGTQPTMREALEAFLSRESYRRLQDAAGEETFEDFLDFGDENAADFPGSPYSLADEAEVFDANRRIAAAAAVAPQEPPEVPPEGRREPAPEGKRRKGGSSVVGGKPFTPPEEED